VLVVWEPILPSDWRPPGGAALKRLPDARVQQFWDPNHVVAGVLNEIVRQKPPQPEPDCCIGKGFYWDEAILYSSGARWNEVPGSVFWNGPVYHIVPNLEKSLAELAKPASPHTEVESKKAVSHFTPQ